MLLDRCRRMAWSESTVGGGWTRTPHPYSLCGVTVVLDLLTVRTKSCWNKRDAAPCSPRRSAPLSPFPLRSPPSLSRLRCGGTRNALTVEYDAPWARVARSDGVPGYRGASSLLTLTFLPFHSAIRSRSVLTGETGSDPSFLLGGDLASGLSS